MVVYFYGGPKFFDKNATSVTVLGPFFVQDEIKKTEEAIEAASGKVKVCDNKKGKPEVL